MAKHFEPDVQADENWRKHVKHERIIDNHVWPQQWEFLIDEYSRLNRILSDRDHSDPPPRATARTLTKETLSEMPVVKLPPISGHGSHSDWLVRKLPLTTQKDYGYRVTRDWMKNYNKMFTRRPKWSFLNQMGWEGNCMD